MRAVNLLVRTLSFQYGFPVFGFMSIAKPNKNTLLNSYRRCYTERKKSNFIECLTEKLKSVDETNDINSVLDSI